ncbi:MAG TPA: indole-3-glycerol phosphate synthase TrpC [Fimbriimonadales bacterium]|nr:indole-3-glycerol phosphate synthase TrpC [Fimbriimonadales bacterium]
MNILEKIIETKQEEILALKSSVSLQALRKRAEEAEPVRGFLRRLQKDAKPIALIGEVKKASPSRGVLVEHFDVAQIATNYERGGASCLSVLTDERYFQGSLENLKQAKKVTNLPILRKDFLIDEIQILESRAESADAILLIVAAFEDYNKMKALHDLALQLGMDVLVEVHTEKEMEIAANLEARLIGINNRDLTTFSTDLETSVRLAKVAPPKAFLVSESAIWTREDVEKLSEAGIKAVLVGESLMTKSDIAQGVRELLGK